MEKSQYCSPEELRQESFRRLRSILKHAYDETEFYRDAFERSGMHPLEMRDAADLKGLPVLTKDHLREHGSTLIARRWKGDRLIPFKTGGSTGRSVTVYYSYEEMERGVGAALRSFRWSGWNLGEPIGRVWGNPHAKTLMDKVREILLEPDIYLDTMSVSAESVREFAAKWRRLRPTLLHGHAHSLFLLADLCQELGIGDIRPRAIISTSMMLLANERTRIEEVFSCRVTDLYGCEEVGLIASECEEHNGLHLNVENVFVEFLDEAGREVSPGNEGTMVVTSLIHRAMPIIRYRIEDVGVPSERLCRCGRGLPLIERVVGRVADFLWRKDGSRVAGVSLIERTLTAFPGIAQMQIVQEAMEAITLNVVPAAGYGPETEAALQKEMTGVFGPEVIITVKILSQIEQDRNGKYRFAACKVLKAGSSQQ